MQTRGMVAVGVVREFHVDEGWGVIDGPAVPGGCWVHFSAIGMDGYRQLVAGQHVWFRAEQDGFRFRVTKVWTADIKTAGPPKPKHSSAGAYHSRLTLTFNEPHVTGKPDHD